MKLLRIFVLSLLFANCLCEEGSGDDTSADDVSGSDMDNGEEEQEEEEEEEEEDDSIVDEVEVIDGESCFALWKDGQHYYVKCMITYSADAWWISTSLHNLN